MVCELCGSPDNLTKHHLVPQVKCHNKYKEIKNDDSNILVVCQTCHSKIHATWSENELRDRYSTKEKLLEADEMKSYLSWRAKHMNFRSPSTKMANRRR